jgi:hypothetical protein
LKAAAPATKPGIWTMIKALIKEGVEISLTGLETAGAQNAPP